MTIFRKMTLLLGCLLLTGVLRAAETTNLAPLENEFGTFVRPLATEFCFGCHSTEKHKGDLDLERVASLKGVLKEPKIWQKVVEQVDLGEMPPKEKPQPSSAQRQKFLTWINAALDEAARERAGDPGPVVLRRLNNAEYTYTIRDLTGVNTLEPAKEFPADSAAGEGFMNTGNSLVMSPAMLTKYFDAAKAIAAHAVLLPDGFRFSSKNTRRDWTDELVAQIREFYKRYTEQDSGEQVNLQGIVFKTNEGGRIPLERYLAALAAERQGLASRAVSFESVAKARGLSPKYVETLWKVLNAEHPSVLLSPLQKRWQSDHPDIGAMVTEIRQWQDALWKFSSVGHIGKAGGPKAWMEPVNPLTTNLPVRLKLPAQSTGKEITIFLIATDAGDGNTNDIVIWRRPRLVVPGHPDLLLSEARDFMGAAAARRDRLFGSTAKALSAIAAAEGAEKIDTADLAAKHGLDAEDLAGWQKFLGLGSDPAMTLDYLTNQITQSGGYDFVKGWGTPATPLLVANSSDQAVRIPGNMRAHGVAVHPSPTRDVAVGWKSPITGSVRVSAHVAHAHPECGNGVEWFLELRRGQTRQRLANGVAQGSKPVTVPTVENLSIRKGDLISLSIGPRDANHSCDLTDVELSIAGSAETQDWKLSQDVSADVLAANPHSDRFGNDSVWHFYTEPTISTSSGSVIPAGSLLAKWQSLPAGPEKEKASEDLQKLLLGGMPPSSNTADALLYRQLTSFRGPLFGGSAGTHETHESPPNSFAEKWALDASAFGKLPNGAALDKQSIAVRAPAVLEIRLPTDLVAGAEFVTDGALAPAIGAEGSVQLIATTNRPAATSGLIASETSVSAKTGMWTSDNRQVSYNAPIVVTDGSAARARIEADFEDFRRSFPAALCYTKIVPVDEVVTLTLFYREDHHLRRLMLSDAENAQLDRLWGQLHFVSQDALKLVDVFEQLWQYATQDADPKVFEPMRRPIMDGAAAFRTKLRESERAQIDALIEFANRAVRRPLTETEERELRALYDDLRKKELPHEEAFRLTLARVFVSPAFLYRLEKAAPGDQPGPVTDYELASRLSYFLWSSAPDEELLAVAKAGKLHDPDILAEQARRMLKDPRIRRLATEFGCAWAHIHDFESLDEKSERYFPTFTGLRGAMYEEGIRFFTDIFQRDGAILEIVDSDFTYLNEDLARHYGIAGVTGPEWRRVEGIRSKSRGGILGLSATLARQSGASRTSPILRGNWVAETLLGEKLPRPPKGVPQLPADEGSESLTVRELVEQHSKDPKCIGCHMRIDGYGYALEGFDAIGRTRSKDLGGRPVLTAAKLYDGTAVDGFDGLRNYLATTRRDTVVRQFCRKLLGYSLGRGVLLSDQPLLIEMQERVKQNGYRFSAAVETILRSRQFREIRGIDMASDD